MSETSRTAILGLIDSDTAALDESMSMTNARLVGALVKSLPAGPNTTTLIKQRILTSHITLASILNLNAVLLESPTSLTHSYAQETSTVICHGIGSKNTSIADNSVLAAGKYLLSSNGDADSNLTTPVIEKLAAVIPPGGFADTRRLSLVVIRTVSRRQGSIVHPHVHLLAQPIFASVRDMVIPVKLAAEAAFLEIFSVVEQESAEFDEYMAGAGTSLNPTTKRSMQDYFKRVAMRLGGQARERKEAEGGQGGLGLSNDEREDEREVWSVGKVDLGEGAFTSD
ncbi:MAG: hypothetical protein Q9183_006700 [Haloplaca sp. 2 TL-2023]